MSVDYAVESRTRLQSHPICSGRTAHDRPVAAVETDAIVVGGGPVGLSLGLALSMTGNSVALVDKAKAPRPGQTDRDGRTYIVTPPTKSFLQTLGVWDGVRRYACAVDRIEICESIPASANEIAPLRFGGSGGGEAPVAYILEGRHLVRVLWDRARACKNIAVLDGVGLDESTARTNAVSASLSDGRSVTGALLLGCDGRRSATAAISGIQYRDWAFGQAAIVFTVEHGHREAASAYQCLLPEGPFSVLPLTNRSSSIMWTETPACAEQLMSLGDAAFSREAQRILGPLLGPFASLGRRSCFPLHSSIARTFVAPRTALVGDAAHAFHPITGQGLNFGFRDIAALSSILMEAKLAGEDIGGPEVLRRYEKARRLEASLMAFATNSIISAYRNRNGLVVSGRRFALNMLGTMPFVRDYLVQQANGQVPLLPRLS